MEKLPEILSCRLSEKVLTPIEGLRLVKDVVNIIGDRGEFTIPLVNQKLETLGWGKEIIDSTSFELIVFLHENQDGYESIKTKHRPQDYLCHNCVSIYD